MKGQVRLTDATGKTVEVDMRERMFVAASEGCYVYIPAVGFHVKETEEEIKRLLRESYEDED